VFLDGVTIGHAGDEIGHDAGAVTPALRGAVSWYQDTWRTRLFGARQRPPALAFAARSRPAAPGDGADPFGERPEGFAEASAPDITCDALVRPRGEFTGPARKAFCTNLAAEVAALTAEALCRFATSRPAIGPAEGP